MQMQPQSVRYLIEFWVVTFPTSICALVRSNWTPPQTELTQLPMFVFLAQGRRQIVLMTKGWSESRGKALRFEKDSVFFPQINSLWRSKFFPYFFCLYIWNSIQYRYIDVNKYAHLKANFTTKVVSHSLSMCCYNWMFSSLFWLPQNVWWILNKEFGA